MKKPLLFFLILLIFSIILFCLSNPTSWSKETKSILTMSFVGLAPIAYETIVPKFEFHNSFQFVSEGWFGQHTSFGGMDKLTHLHFGYFFVRWLTPLYESYGYNNIIIEYDENGNVQYENDLDEDGNVQLDYEYDTRFLNADGSIIATTEEYMTKLNNDEEVYIAQFVGCTYHCG